MRWLELTTLVFVIVLSPHVEASPPTEKAAGGDLLSHPGLLISNASAKDLTLNGIRIGDPEFRIPKESIVTGRNGAGWIFCATGSYRIDGGKVAEIMLKDPQALASLGLKHPSDIELRFGKPDRVLPGDVYYWDSRHRKAMWDKDHDGQRLDAFGVVDYETARATPIIPKTPEEERFVRTLQVQIAFDKEAKDIEARSARIVEDEHEELLTLRAENRVLRLELDAALEAASQQKSSPSPDAPTNKKDEMSDEEIAALHAKLEERWRISDGVRRNRIVVGMTMTQVEGVLRNRPDLPLDKKDRTESRGANGKVIASESWWIKANGHLALLSFTDGKLTYMGD